MLRSQVFDGAELASIGDATTINPPRPPSYMVGEENGMEDEREGSSEGSGGPARKKRRSLPDSTDLAGKLHEGSLRQIIFRIKDDLAR